MSSLPESLPRRRHVWICLALFVFAVLLRASMWGQASAPLAGDESEYHSLARSLLHGTGYVSGWTGKLTARRTPGLPLLVAGIYALFGEDYARARIVLTFVGALGAPALYLLCLALFRRWQVGLVAAALWSLLWNGRYLSGLLMGEPPAAVCVILALLALETTMRRGRAREAVLTGVLTAAGIYLRGFLLPLILLPPLYGWVRGRFRLGCLATVVCALLLSVWVVRNTVALGLVGFASETDVLWQGNNQWARGAWPGDWQVQEDYLAQRIPGFRALSEAERSRVFTREFLYEVRTHPGRFLWLLPRKALLYLGPLSYMGNDWLSLAFLPFAGLGALVLARDRDRRHLLVLLGYPVLGVLLVCLIAFGDSRFRMPVDSCLMALAAVGLDALVRRDPALRVRRGPAAGA